MTPAFDQKKVCGRWGEKKSFKWVGAPGLARETRGGGLRFSD